MVDIGPHENIQVWPWQKKKRIEESQKEAQKKKIIIIEVRTIQETSILLVGYKKSNASRLYVFLENKLPVMKAHGRSYTNTQNPTHAMHVLR